MQPTPIQIGSLNQPIRSLTGASKHRGQNMLKEQLKDRLYDKGVNPGKLPSVTRPNSERMRPYTAKLASKLAQKQGHVGAGRNAQMKSPFQIPLSTYKALVPGTMTPDEDPFPPPSGTRGKSLYGKEEIERPITREEGCRSNVRVGASGVLRSITGVTVMFSMSKTPRR